MGYVLRLNSCRIQGSIRKLPFGERHAAVCIDKRAVTSNEGTVYEMSAMTGKLCPCGSGLPGRRQWSQGCPDKIACPACFVRTRERTPTAPISGKRDQRNAIARRKLEELREQQALSD
jgi:hypothetical protein